MMFLEMSQCSTSEREKDTHVGSTGRFHGMNNHISKLDHFSKKKLIEFYFP